MGTLPKLIKKDNKLNEWRPHEESNLDLRFRKPLFYPLNYGGVYQNHYIVIFEKKLQARGCIKIS
jgi:hypothetical protein